MKRRWQRSAFWVHEDDFAQVEILPLGCWDFCRAQLIEIDAFSEAHRAPDGIGWTRMYVRQAGPQSIADLAIGVDELAAAMPWRLRRVDRVTSGGWGDEGVVQPRTAAYLAGQGGFSLDVKRLLSTRHAFPRPPRRVPDVKDVDHIPFRLIENLVGKSPEQQYANARASSDWRPRLGRISQLLDR